MIFKKVFVPLSVLYLISGILLIGCKKIDLERVAYVKTEFVTDIELPTAIAHGNIVDLGEGEIIDHGFCVSNDLLILPTKSDICFSKGPTAATGNYSCPITGLAFNTAYLIRAYIENGYEITYGEVMTFGDIWLHYDDGLNFNGIGLTDGSNFDYAIRFPVQSLANFDNYQISKIKFFPTASATFHVEVYEGVNPPSLVFYEPVNNPVLNTWNEYSPAYTYYIDSSVEVWVGVWVTYYDTETYPAGVDNGPAVAGAGDLISFDDGATWESLFSLNPEYNYNWNLEVFITSPQGKAVKLENYDKTQSKKVHFNGTGGDAGKLDTFKDLN